MSLRRISASTPATLFDSRVDAALATPAHLRTVAHYADLDAALADVGMMTGPLRALDDVTLTQAAPALAAITAAALLTLLVLGVTVVQRASRWWLLLWIPVALVGGLAATVGVLVAQESRRRRIVAAVSDRLSLAPYHSG